MILKNRRIFLTEDNLTNRSVIQLLLENEGAIFTFERWGNDDCKTLIKFAPVDIILLDLMLPNNLTGFDVYDQIRRHSQFDHVPIVAVSAKEPDLAIPEVRAKGFDGFIRKPIDRRSFARTIVKLINGEKFWDME